ncbi:MAG: ABC transporter substrate-binding protein [Desulfobacteraceae bacterium]|nr:ABC transporter substrate-binding protein [Desulfobacteraceae bacterium]
MKKIFIRYFLVLLFAVTGSVYADVKKIGLNYPETGHYSVQGLAQKRAAEIAVKEINATGGIMGNTIELVTRDTKSKPALSKKNVGYLIDGDKCEMIWVRLFCGIAYKFNKL